MSVTPERCDAWRLVQIGELLRRSHRAHEQALAQVDRIEVGAELSATGTVTLTDAVAGELEALGEAIAELAAELQVLTAGLPDEAVEVAAEDVRREAASDLATGIFDEPRALLAARVLPFEDGWPALANGLRGSDAHWAWERMTVTQLLGGFRGASAGTVARVLGEAGVPARRPFAACAHEQLMRLAAALDRHAAV